MLVTLLKTTDEHLADICQRNAEGEFGAWNIYRFQYWSNDGNFYYEILRNDD